MNLTHPSLALALAIAVTACASGDGTKTDTTSITTSSSTVTTPQPEPDNVNPNPPPPAPAPAPTTGWVVTDHGIGNLAVGMTVEEARAVYPTFRVPSSPDGSACSYATLDGWPAGVGVMVDGGKVARVEVRRGKIATSAGASIGDTEQRIQGLYPGQVTVSPHKYTDGHYLTVVPKSPADSSNRIVFETDGRRVVNYRVGVRPQVEYVEGCS